MLFSPELAALCKLNDVGIHGKEMPVGEGGCSRPCGVEGGVGQQLAGKVLPQSMVQQWVWAVGRCSKKGLRGVKKVWEIHQIEVHRSY